MQRKYRESPPPYPLPVERPDTQVTPLQDFSLVNWGGGGGVTINNLQGRKSPRNEVVEEAAQNFTTDLPVTGFRRASYAKFSVESQSPYFPVGFSRQVRFDGAAACRHLGLYLKVSAIWGECVNYTERSSVGV